MDILHEDLNVKIFLHVSPIKYNLQIRIQHKFCV
jgi:hypothetical protein